MTMPDPHAPAYDPFGEPMAFPRGCAGDDRSGVGSYRETRRAALVFWALAILFVGGRIVLSDQPATHDIAATESTSATIATER